jgi:amidophosphoribosyltransferase
LAQGNDRVSKLVQIVDDHFHDECGVFGVFGNAEASKLTYLGLYALQHRGQESAGIASTDGENVFVHKGMGEVQEIFTPEVIAKLRGPAAIGHTRYSTAGDTVLTNAQPVVIDCNKGKLALAHNGNLTNALELRRRLEHRGSIFQTTSDTEVIVHLIARSNGRNLSGAIADALNQVEGAYSLLLLTRDEIYAIRDPRGFRPLVLGRLDGAWVAASETCAFDLIDAEYVREVEPGEMVRISRAGVESIHFAPEKPHQYCIFEHVYFSRPDSIIFGRPVNQSRERLGRLLAREHPRRSWLRGGIGNSVSHGADSQSLHRAHVHRAGTVHPGFRRKAQAESGASNVGGATRGAGGRFDRARNNQPENRAHGARSGRGGSARAHQLPAHDFSLLLWSGYAATRGTDRGEQFSGRNPALSGRGFARLPLA